MVMHDDQIQNVLYQRENINRCNIFFVQYVFRGNVSKQFLQKRFIGLFLNIIFSQATMFVIRCGMYIYSNTFTHTGLYLYTHA